jgi:hypothetical protein
MKTAVVTIVIVLLASTAFAQGASDATGEQIHWGSRKIGITAR